MRNPRTQPEQNANHTIKHEKTSKVNDNPHSTCTL